jgi:uncharacterized protein involved in exopolysaccharide biosynthesis
VAGLLLRRLWLVLALAALGGGTAAFATSDAPVVYERTAVFVLRPSSEINDEQVPDAIRGIAQQDSQLVRTVSRVIATDRFLDGAFDIAFARDPAPGYELSSVISPGSDVIEVSLRGPDESTLDAVVGEFAAEASKWVVSVYRAYTLDLLEVNTPSGPVGTDPFQLIALAALLAGLMGVGVVFLEHKARKARAPEPPAAAPSAEPASPVVHHPPQGEWHSGAGPALAHPPQEIRRRPA